MSQRSHSSCVTAPGSVSRTLQSPCPFPNPLSSYSFAPGQGGKFGDVELYYAGSLPLEYPSHIIPCTEVVRDALVPSWESKPQPAGRWWLPALGPVRHYDSVLNLDAEVWIS